MTVSTTDSSVEYTAGGPAFPVPFRFLQNSDIQAVLVDQNGNSETLTSAQYVLTGAGTPSGGTLTSSYAAGVLATPGSVLTISRIMTPVQPADLRNQGRYLAETQETSLDRLTMLIQQSLSGLTRALRRPFGKSYYDAEGWRIANLADPIQDQDATTRVWVGRYFGDLIDQASGLINTTTGILYDSGTLFDHLRFGVARSVDSIAALRLLSGARNQRAFALGYYEKGDHGGGHYFIDPADTTSADNGGTVIVGADGSRWKLAYLNRVSIDQFGAKRNNLGADAPFNDAAVQAAFNAGVPLSAGKGVYQFSLSRSITLEAGATVCALIMATGLNILGAGIGQTILKVRDNESTDASPKFFNFIAGNQAYEYCRFEGVTFDLNGQNNKISPLRSSDTYNPYNCAAVMISGSVATGGADARISKSKFLYCEIINSPGVTGIALGQRYGHPGIKGFDVEIAHCRFYNNGIDAGDHSSIYAFCNYVNAHDNVFDHPVASTGKGGPVCCIELFGSHNAAHSNKVNNYLQFAWIGAGEEGLHSDILIYNNQGNVSYRFIDTWSFGPQVDGIADLMIFGNQINITDSAIGTPGLDRVAVNLQMNMCALDRVKVYGNRFKCFDRTNNTGIVIAPGAGQRISGVSMFGNTIDGFSRGIGGGSLGAMFDISASDNDIIDCHATTSRPVDTRGIDFGGTNTFCTLKLSDNRISGGDLQADPFYSIVIVGTYASLHVDGNTVRAVNDIEINAAISGRRTGSQARRYALPPTDGLWFSSEHVENNGVAVLGTAGSRYTIRGWVSTAPGSGLAANWVEERVLTGT